MTELGRASRVRPDAVVDLLEHGDLELTGRLVQASNATFLGRLSYEGQSVDCVYKPVRGERPLWDFPSGTLASREVAAYLVSEAGGWDVVPPTVTADGPFGPGMVQAWVDVVGDIPVDVVGVDAVPEGWLHVLDAYDGEDHPVSLVHADSAGLRSMALFDAVVNNADRKGGHVLPDDRGRVLGCDHGVCFHVDDKLRSVLWGWAGEPLDADERERLARTRDAVSAGTGPAQRLDELIDSCEQDALLARIDVLLAVGEFPLPGEHWPSIPWPPF